MKNIKFWKVFLIIIILASLLLIGVSLVYNVNFLIRQPHGDNPFPVGVLRHLRLFRLK